MRERGRAVSKRDVNEERRTVTKRSDGGRGAGATCTRTHGIGNSATVRKRAQTGWEWVRAVTKR